jgi:hypothetical protein
MMSTFLICFSGFVISYRLFSALLFRFHLEKKVLTTIFAVVLGYDLLVIWAEAKPLAVWLSQVCVMIGIFLSPRLIERHLERKLKRSVVTILDQLLLTVQTGASLRSAIKSHVERERGWRHYELMKAYSQLILVDEAASLSSEVLRDLFEELKWIDQSRTRVLEQLKSLRWHYKVQEDFRRKSVQVAQQTRIQAFVVSCLYVALLAFNIFHFGFLENIKLILASLFLFSIGVVSVFILGRRIKWKV